MKSLLRFSLIILSFGYLGAMAQNTAPVAVDDSLIVYVYESNTIVDIDVLVNDYDPGGEEIVICDVVPFGSTATAGFNDSLIFANIPYLYELIYYYRVCHSDNQDVKSNWAKLYINPQWGENTPIARNDTIEGLLDYTYQVNVLLNDTDPQGDPIYFRPDQNVVGDSILSITVGWNYDHQTGYYEYPYFITDSLGDSIITFDMAYIVVKIKNTEWYDSLNINNVNARYNSFGNHFWDMDGEAQYEVPAGGGVSSLFSGAFWLGGLDTYGELHFAGERYRQFGEDYWTGPVSNTYDSLYDAYWLHIWKLNREEIEYHKAHWWESGYEPLSDILSWPAHGDTSLNQSAYIAPFEDHDNNGVYEPMLGDAPIIKGDQALFFVFNDARKLHTESQGKSMGIEISAMAYAYNLPSDSALWSTTFLQYQITNKSDTTYTDTYAGFFIDTDLGNYSDEYVGCNVEGGYFYNYKASSGGSGGYGEYAPALAVLFLAGPFLPEDGIDNPKFDLEGIQICDESLNGLNFGDSIVDNERMGMTNYIYFNNGATLYGSDPAFAAEYYNYLKSIWKDSTALLYGAQGHISTGAVGPDCRFMFPGDSDTCNWGTNGVPPNGGLNTPGNYWTEESVENVPGDRRGLGSSGPFTFAPGQVETFDIAFVWARAYDGDPWSSAELLEEYCASIKDMFENDEAFFSNTQPTLINDKHLLVYPNPAKGSIQIKSNEEMGELTYIVYSVSGYNLLSATVKHPGMKFQINISDLPQGVYLLRVINKDGVVVKRFVKWD